MHSLPELLDKIAAYQKQNPFPDQPPGLYEPCDYILELGGKRLRPALLLMAYELYRENPDPALPLAWTVELFHNFTLMHDDIMDQAPLRRGKPTVHTVWNTTTAILSGDIMLIKAYESLAAGANRDTLPELLRIFNQAAREVCEGQQMDVNFETRNDVGIPEYLRMIELKTAVLLGAAMQMGAVAAGASPADAERLYHFGRLAGVAFQIQDDLLDTYGDPLKFGKKVGGDILQNKKTLLVLKTLETASEADRTELLQWMQGEDADPDQKIAAVKAIFDRNGIPALISAEKQRHQQMALEQLDRLEAPAPQQKVIRAFVADLLERDH